MIITDFIQTETKPSRSVPRGNVELANRVDNAVSLVEAYESAEYSHRRAWHGDVATRRNNMDATRRSMERERFDIFEIMGGAIPKRLHKLCQRIKTDH